ncbi:hypothetical protein SAMN05892877_103412 [Rhizobium subbaraonis]|uniref:DNA-binding protein n=1 Tax=Rhizobium subbaraonis TaxID=908946 RepID=A0A285U6P7_9HYPH|nr:ATP-binding protein [Rhizobium subbaraonis]SOC37068.1 hypothetical protein SAMN05892877_103412 [Rhizobium subbaraonis]
MSEFTRQRLEDLLIDPVEHLGVEIKNWLDLSDNGEDKANLAKAILALANHGGGVVILGLSEENGQMIEAIGRPATFDRYSQDLINGIVKNYADPHFHCQVYVVLRHSTGLHYPIVIVPGGHKVPVKARRAGPNGNTVHNHAIYMRKPGPKSEIPLTSAEWDEVLARCIANRRDELADHLRAVLSGTTLATLVGDMQPKADTLQRFIEASLSEWEKLVAPLPPNSPARFPEGKYWYSYEISGDRPSFTPAQMAHLLQKSVVRHTGWPPFWYPTRPEIAPYWMNDAMQCWLGDPTTSTSFTDAAHCDFWRISPDGLAFLMRGYQEDNPEIKERRGGAKLFDITLPVWRFGEILLHASRLAENMFEGPTSITFRARFDGLAGRKLTSIDGSRYVTERVARQDAIELVTTIDGQSIETNLPEIVVPFLEPLYALFDLMELPPALVLRELAELRSSNF